MTHIIQIVAGLLFGWPALVAGYIAAEVRSGWTTGLRIHEDHEEALFNALQSKEPK